MKQIASVFLLLTLVMGKAMAQGLVNVANDQHESIDQLIELIAESMEIEDLDFTTMLEDLSYYYRHPLNLNKADREDLDKLYVLDDFKISALLSHIATTGEMISVDELQGIDGFDVSTINALLPFVKVGGPVETAHFTLNEALKEGRSEFFVRYQQVLEPMAGYEPASDSLLAASPNARYLGSPERIYSRYRFRYGNHLSFGVTGEKDAGEQFFSGTEKQGFDFYSAHLYLGDYGIIKHAIIGDYQVQFGQGLTYWTGLAFGKKSVNILSVKRSAREITPYTSAMESNFQRGAATTLRLNKYTELTTFLSHQKIDANATVYDTTGLNQVEVSQFSTLKTSGYHRTLVEIADKHAITETNTGAHLTLKHDRIKLGFTGVYTGYSALPEAKTQLYQQFQPISKTFVVAGMDYQYMVGNILGFGEISQRMDGGAAFINGAMFSLDPKVDVVVLQRVFSPAYYNPRCNAIAESSRANNESGLYLGMTAKLNSKFTFTTYYDLFTFMWLRFQSDSPTRGKEFLGQLDYKPNKKLSAYARYRFEQKEQNLAVDSQPTAAIAPISRQWARINVSYNVSSSISIRSRIERTIVELPEGTTEHGWVLFQDMAYKPKFPAKSEVKVRYAMFDTDGYNSRIYTYEQDVPYSFSVPAIYYRGSRFYFIFSYDMARWSTLVVRISQTYYANQKTSGSGLNQIDSPTRTEVKLQWSVKF